MKKAISQRSGVRWMTSPFNMPAVGVSVANTDFDAAQALLDLQSNVRETRAEQCNNHDDNIKDDMEKSAKVFLSCLITSDLTNSQKQIPSTNISNNDKNIVTQNKLVIEPIYKTSTPVHNEYQSSIYTRMKYSEKKDSEISNRSRIFKRHLPEQYHDTYKHPEAQISCITGNNNIAKNKECKKESREMGTQTDDTYDYPNIIIMENTIKNLCEKIRLLEAQIKISQAESISEDDADISYGQNENVEDLNMTPIDYSNITASDINEDNSELTDNEAKTTPKKTFSKVLRTHNTNGNDMVPIGDGNATVPSRVLRHINWTSYTSATRKLLTAVFSRSVLATHSLTGKPSPAFPNKPAKKKLDPILVNDIVQTVVERCAVPENVVRTSITTKCADESKMFRTRQQNSKKKHKHKVNRENIPPSTSDSDE